MAGLIDQASWETEIYQLERTDAVVGGVPNVVTKAGTSNIPHLLLANRTQWLRAQVEALQNGAGYRGAAIFGANQTLTAADMGRCLVFNGTAAATLTLPAFSAVPDGSAVEIINTGTANLTITRAGSDQIDTGPATATSLVVPAGQSAKLLRATGSPNWHPVSLTASALTTAFGASIGATGWQRLPSGLILQYGFTVAGLTGAGVYSGYSITLPIAFPTAARAAFASVSAPTSNMIMAAAANCSTTQIGVYMVGEGALANGSQRVDWFVIGN